jgi:hypothetical protein
MGSKTDTIMAMLIFLVVVASLAVLWKLGSFIKVRFMSGCGIESKHHHHSNCGQPTDCAGAPVDGAMSDTPYVGDVNSSSLSGGSIYDNNYNDDSSLSLNGGATINNHEFNLPATMRHGEDHVHSYSYLY